MKLKAVGLVVVLVALAASSAAWAQAGGDGNARGPNGDSDADGFPDTSDNCPAIPNAGQENADGDASGDVCDEDDDNDTVLDGPDRCDLVDGGGSASGCPVAQRTLTIRHVLNRAELSGRLLAPGYPQCRQRQRVTIFRALPGSQPDVNLGTVITLDNGTYKFEGATNGPYYAKTRRKLIPNVAECSAATSPNSR